MNRSLHFKSLSTRAEGLFYFAQKKYRRQLKSFVSDKIDGLIRQGGEDHYRVFFNACAHIGEGGRVNFALNALVGVNFFAAPFNDTSVLVRHFGREVNARDRQAGFAFDFADTGAETLGEPDFDIAVAQEFANCRLKR